MAGLLIPDFQIPASQSVLGISIIDTSVRITAPLNQFTPDGIPGNEDLHAPAFSFLLEHSSGQKIVFDLGFRPDYENLPPNVINPILEMVEEGSWAFTIDSDVATILEDGGIDRADIDTIILSHTHLDHIGDPSAFPNTTSLIVGPGFAEHFIPGYPANPNGLVLQSDYEGRELREIDFDATPLTIGRFQAYDYFDDGSLYLLDSPGHAFGHINALVRTTPDTFIFLGADTAHHGGMWRPSPRLPLPKVLKPSPYSEPPFRPGTHFPGKRVVDEIHPYQEWDQPFYQTYTGAADRNVTEIGETISKMTDFDARDDVFVVIAHDISLLDIVNLFPKKANDWKKKGWKKQSHWKFLADFKEALD